MQQNFGRLETGADRTERTKTHELTTGKLYEIK
jgi:hypothetical protein